MQTRGTIAIRLKPRAGSNRIQLEDDGTLTISVTSPPVDNKANDQLIALVAKRLGCTKQALSIIKGGHSRDKVIACDTLSSEAMKMLFEKAV